MRHRSAAALALSLGIGIAAGSAANAATLGFTGTLSIRFPVGTPGPAAEIGIAGGGLATVNGSGPGGHLVALGLAGGEFMTSGATVPITDPAVFAIAGLQLTVANGPAAFAGIGGGGFGGPMALNGAAKVCLYGACGASTNVANLTVPLSVVGVGGTQVLPPGGPFKVTVIGAPWTTGTAAVGTSFTAMGGVSPLSNTAAASGVVTLVTPILISTDLGSPIVPAFGFLTLHFVPEPTTAALVGIGIAALLAGARSRARHPS
jgi:hypothetical protein